MMKAIKQNTMLENINMTITWSVFILAACMLIKVLGLANVGFDLTDEGYYLNWISNPWLYKYYASQFGYIYHPLYKAVGNSITHLRQANMLISFGLSWVLSCYILRYAAPSLTKVQSITMSAGLALSGLFILMIKGHWVPSPSYNSLNFQGCLIATLGFLFSINTEGKNQQLSACLIGLGGWLVFMAKPSTALFLALTAVVFYSTSLKNNWRILVGAGLVSTALLIISAILIDGSISQFINRYQGGMLLMSTMDGTHTIGNLLRLDLFSVSESFLLKFILLSCALLLGFKFSKESSDSIKSKLAIIILAIALITTLQTLTPSTRMKYVDDYHLLILCAVLLASFIFNFISAERSNSNPNIDIKFTTLLLCMPYLFASGSGNNYWFTASGVSIFWVCAALLLITKKSYNLLTINIAVVFVTSICVMSIFDAMRSPYRQSESILSQSGQLLEPHANQTLLLPKDTKNYLHTLQELAKKNNFKNTNPVIDLTGHHPGSLYFLKADAIGQAWTIGAYAGSLDLAALSLNQASCSELANAWLLYEKGGTRRLSEAILAQHGIQASKLTYKKVGTLQTQKLVDFGSVNRMHPNGIYDQYLLKPIDIKQQTKNCIGYRKQHPSQKIKYKSNQTEKEV